MGRTDPTITNLDVLARNGFEPTLHHDLLPTPTARDEKGPGAGGQQGGADLPAVLLPTPTARDGDRGLPSPRLAAERMETRSNLDDATALLPTPTASDAASARNTTSGRSNPDSRHHDGTTLTDALVPASDPTDTVSPEVDHAHPAEARPTPVLPSVRGGDEAQEVQRPARGSQPVSLQSDLFAGVREHEERGEVADPALEGEAAPCRDVQGVRRDRGPACPPLGPQPGEQRADQSGDALRILPSEAALAGGSARWGRYAPAVRRWELILGRPAPDPICGRAVSALAVEWMMGVPPGWVTDHLPNRKALRVLGNGVVPQCAAAAVTALGRELER